MKPKYEIGDTVDYRRVLNIPCEPMRGEIVEYYLDNPEDGRYVVDFGPTEYEAPYDRQREVCWAGQLTKVETSEGK